MRRDQHTNAPNSELTPIGGSEDRPFVAFFGRRTGRGSGAAEKYSPRAEFISILAMLFFGILILVVAYRVCFGRL